MSRSEAAEAERPADSELLRELDQKLRERATKSVDRVLTPAQERAIRAIAEDLSVVASHIIKGDVVRHIHDACSRIRDSAIEATYRDLLRRVTNQLADGKPIDLS